MASTPSIFELQEENRRLMVCLEVAEGHLEAQRRAAERWEAEAKRLREALVQAQQRLPQGA